MDKIISAARGWIGTPFRYQQCVKGEGVDCVQLVAAVGYECGLCDLIPRDRSDYPRIPPLRRLMAGLRGVLDEITDPMAGDVLLIAWRTRPIHLAIMTSDSTMVHATEHAGVIECDIEFQFVHSFWRYRVAR